jgi:hypothetical protein
MKNFTLFVLLVFSTAAAWAQDTIANGGFESWTNFPAQAYNEPNDWNTPNPQLSALSTITVNLDSSIVHAGKYSCKLTTLYVAAITSNVPGTITTGVIPSAEGQSISGGVPVHSRIMSVSGYYQYVPAGADSGGANISLVKNGVVIGTGSFDFMDTVKTWTPFAFNVNYTSDSIPDTSLLTFVSSINNGVKNSSLWLDDLKYSYTTVGIHEVPTSQFAVYPNPAGHEINIDNQTMQANTLNLTSTTGQLIKVIKLHAGLNTVDVSTLADGVYILSGVGVNGGSYSSSVVVNK